MKLNFVGSCCLDGSLYHVDSLATESFSQIYARNHFWEAFTNDLSVEADPPFQGLCYRIELVQEMLFCLMIILMYLAWPKANYFWKMTCHGAMFYSLIVSNWFFFQSCPKLDYRCQGLDSNSLTASEALCIRETACLHLLKISVLLFSAFQRWTPVDIGLGLHWTCSLQSASLQNCLKALSLSALSLLLLRPPFQ